MHKIAGCLVVGEGVPELLSDPRCRRVGGDGGVDDASTVMPQDHQHEEEPERDCGHDEQVGGHDLAGVIREERPPGLRRWARMPTADRGAHLKRHSGSSSAPAALPGPVEPKAAPVPRDDGLRFDDHQSRPPTPPGSGESRPQHAVRRLSCSCGRRERLITESLCRSARISRCIDARERTRNPSE